MFEILFFCMCVFVLFLFVSRLQRLSRVKFYRVNSRFYFSVFLCACIIFNYFNSNRGSVDFVMQNVQDMVSIEPFKSEFASELKALFRSNSEDTTILNHGLKYSALKSLGYLPPITRLIAYHTQDKAPIGFIGVEETVKTVFSIQFLFVNPKYRKMGIGTRLLEEAIAVAKKKGAEKLNLAVYPTSRSAIELYKRYGFRELGRTTLFQGVLPGFSASKAIWRVLFRRAGLKSDPLNNVLFASSMSVYFRKICFGIFKSCMGDAWVGFFQLTADNLKYGSRNVWQPRFVKALVGRGNDSFALLFNQVLPLRDIVELYFEPGVAPQPVLEDLLSILSSRGVGFTKFWLYGLTEDISVEWLSKSKMMAFDFVCMGKSL